jgi:hypothetical protein
MTMALRSRLSRISNEHDRLLLEIARRLEEQAQHGRITKTEASRFLTDMIREENLIEQFLKKKRSRMF